MKIEIRHNTNDNTYVWSLWDGPDGIDFFEGVEVDLGQCFEQIITRRVINGLHYTGRW